MISESLKCSWCRVGSHVAEQQCLGDAAFAFRSETIVKIRLVRVQVTRRLGARSDDVSVAMVRAQVMTSISHTLKITNVLVQSKVM